MSSPQDTPPYSVFAILSPAVFYNLWINFGEIPLEEANISL